MRNEEVIEYPVEQSTLTQRYTQEAVDFIAGNRDKPFFLYLPRTVPMFRWPLQPHLREKAERLSYGDAIEEVDWSVGRILNTLKELDLEHEYAGPVHVRHGPWLEFKADGGSALPLRDGKFTTYEGGMREPCVARWPGTIPGWERVRRGSFND